ncbi:MAG: hypothetical protein A2021_01000 [Elusimicrobia bacterium GWF2_52_66]|nr:MAG: hypothetical protein A2021_01000 [Elusimicrobia bacterium GWF2_52_66]HAF95374.1 hypothetical protein [Elusimicrobiota bacterium]HCE98762.1 hypothetical protein [Elusimicrobiota bacterium]
MPLSQLMPKKFLVMVFKGIGDVLLTTPLVRALKKNIPGAEIYFLTKKSSEKILRFNSCLSGVFVREETCLGEIRSRKLDTTMDFMNSSSSGAYALLSGAGRRLAFRHPLGRIFHNVLIEKEGPARYTVYDRLEMLKPLGVPHDGIGLDLRFAPENAEKALDFLKRSGLESARPSFVIFDITSPRRHRCWPPEKFIALADRLEADFRLRSVFLAGPGELDYVKSALSSAKSNHLLCSDFDLLDIAALERHAALHAGVSSAPMHIAVSQGTPTFTVYSPNDSPKDWGPPLPIHSGLQADLEILGVDELYAKLSAHVRTLKL